MKKILLLVLALSLFLSSAAAEVDLSGMSYDELVALRDQLNLAIWSCQEWQEVEVPAGVWEVGKDIPSGHWTITIVDGASTNVLYTDRLDEYGKTAGLGWRGYITNLNALRNHNGDYYDPNASRSFDLVMDDGMYFIIDAPVVFSPYSGKPDLGFK